MQTTMTILERDTLRRVAWRLLPLLMVSYFIAFVDRVNVGFAALQMNRDLGLSSTQFGLAGGLFFLTYALCEVPSNLLMQRLGARLWIARIMISWGLVSASMALVQGPNSLYALRLLLGAAEAGFFPGVILYLTYWFPREYRARIVALFMVAIPISSFLGSPLSALLLQLDGAMGLRGWQWLFIVEALPAVLLGFVVLWLLPDRPDDARWLTSAQRDWLNQRLAGEARAAAPTPLPLRQLFANPRVLVAALLCSGSVAVSQCLSLWQPQFLRSFGLSELETGLANAVPFGIASMLMIWWGRRSDARGERVWHTALPLTLCALAMLSTLGTSAFLPTLALLTLTLIGTYAFKGPFWSLTTEWLGARNAAAGIAYVNAIGAVAVFAGSWVLGAIHDATGSYPIALLPFVAVCLAGAITLALMRQQRDC